MRAQFDCAFLFRQQFKTHPCSASDGIGMKYEVANFALIGRHDRTNSVRRRALQNRATKVENKSTRVVRTRSDPGFREFCPSLIAGSCAPIDPIGVADVDKVRSRYSIMDVPRTSFGGIYVRLSEVREGLAWRVYFEGLTNEAGPGVAAELTAHLSL
jgi:hypothetical protein